LTKVTTIIEYDTPEGKVVNAHNDQGLSARIIYSNNEAKLTFYEGNEVEEQYEHSDDAMAQLLGRFFD
jgi:hypothetical protein